MPVNPLAASRRPIDAGLRGAAGVHPFHHRGVLGSHESRGLSAGDAQRMERFDRTQAEHFAAAAPAANVPEVALG